MAADRLRENIPRRTFLGGLGAAAGSVLLQPPAGPADYYGGPSSDGRYLTFVEKGDLGVRDLVTDNKRILTSRPEESPQFAFRNSAVSGSRLCDLVFEVLPQNRVASASRGSYARTCRNVRNTENFL